MICLALAFAACTFLHKVRILMYFILLYCISMHVNVFPRHQFCECGLNLTISHRFKNEQKQIEKKALRN